MRIGLLVILPQHLQGFPPLEYSIQRPNPTLPNTSTDSDLLGLRRATQKPASQSFINRLLVFYVLFNHNSIRYVDDIPPCLNTQQGTHQVSPVHPAAMNGQHKAPVTDASKSQF